MPQAKPNADDWAEFAALVAFGAIAPVVDHTFAFDDAAGPCVSGAGARAGEVVVCLG
jgi:NADPH:quinone reductase-like Zn-dependent oxidoreductase